jgi:hypothetical protein
MGFFDSLPKPAPPDPPRHFQHPPWVEPGRNIMPATLAVDGVLVRTPTVGVFADGFRVYPYGFNFSITVLINGFAGEEQAEDPLRLYPRFRQTEPSRADRDNALRIGVEFPNGRGASIFSPREPEDGSAPPLPPVIDLEGGSGGGNSWTQGFWVWDLPTSGDVSIVYSWLARSIPESRLTLDGEILRAAAARAVVLWPEPEPAQQGADDAGQ